MSKSGLTRQQKEAVGLLSIGTFLEYFDLMLYVHMAVLLNELFFPKTDPMIASMFAAFTFCLTYILRPLGGFIIGRIGDKLGRKFTVFVTTSIMATSCIVMANLPTYAEIGITASIIMIACRMLQGISSLGEIVGAEIYISEILKPPYRYVCTGMMFVSSASGGLLALVVSSFVMSAGLGWRFAFWIGSVIAVVGFIARTRLRETPEFADYKLRMKIKAEESEQYGLKMSNNEIANQEKVDKKSVATYLFIKAIDAVCFYVAFIYMGAFMKNSLGMTAEQVIYQNLKVTAAIVALIVIMTQFVKKYHPIKIIRASMLLFAIFLPFLPYCMANVSDLTSLFFLQIAIFSFALSSFGIETACFKHFPVAKRFTLLATTFGVSATLSYTTVSFGLILLTEYFGYYGLWFIFLPLIIFASYAINYLKKLEIERGSYHNYPKEDFPHDDTGLKEEDFNYDDLGDEYDPFKGKCEYSTELLNKINTISEEVERKVNIKLIEKAIVFAKKWHDGQMRKTGNIPYYSHPLAVAGMVAECYLKTDVIVAAILHDVVEDSDCTVEMIEEKFNHRIAEIVDRLTKNRFEGDKKIKLTFEQTLDKLTKLNDNEAAFIKQMDRQHNLETIDGLKPYKQEKMLKETNNYLVRLITIIGEKLGISDKIHLENKLSKLAVGNLKKK